MSQKAVVLRAPLEPTNDVEWVFSPGFPTTSVSRRGKVLGKILTFKPDELTLGWGEFPENRILNHDDSSKFVLASFGGLRFPDTPLSATLEYAKRFLSAGLTLDGIHYRFYGHSNSQLRSRSCFLREGTDEELDERIYSLGDFKRIKNVAKRAKRIGLLFSSASIDMQLDERWTKDIDDIEVGGECFSDGCGLISVRLARQLSKKKSIIFHARRYTPSVFQIRYRGYKGVLMLQPQLDKDKKELVHFRKSMKKFTATSDYTFSVVDYAKPYAYGRLNNDVIVLLSALGISNEALLAKQRSYFDWLQNASEDPALAFDLLSCLDNHTAAEQVLLEGMESDNVRRLIKKCQAAEINSFKKNDKPRTRMLIRKSRLLFGVCDPFGVLREGEVHVRITEPRLGPTSLHATDVMVVRNPCLHPGDILKLRATHRSELDHLVDCVVFSSQGKRPAPSMSSGGDLDGDKFFVCWDPDIVPEKIAESYTYPPGKEPPSREVTRTDLAYHFASYNSASLARITSLHQKWCQRKGAMSSECQELNALHSQCVDGGRIKIPDRLLIEKAENASPFITDLLADEAKTFAESFSDRHARDILASAEETREIIARLLSSGQPSFSEFELFDILLRYARARNVHFAPFLSHISFDALTTANKHALAFALNGMNIPVPDALWNSLIRSDLLTPRDLEDRHLGGPLRLQRLYSSAIQGRAAFFEYLKLAVDGFTRKLIILKTDDRFALGIFIRGSIAWDEDPPTEVNDNVVVCSFQPKATGVMSHYRPTTAGYRLLCSDSLFQLFDRQRGNSFIFITRPPAASRIDIAISVALQKISGKVQQLGRLHRAPVIGIEIHVVSNRDRVAHEIFDLRFSHVETVETMKRFAYTSVPYTKNTLREIDWSEPENAPYQDFFTLTAERAKETCASKSSAELRDLMRLAYKYHADEHLFAIFEAMLTNSEPAIEELRDWLEQCPTLVFVLLKQFLAEERSSLPRPLSSLSQTIVRSVIRSANETRIAALVALEKLSNDIAQLPLPTYLDILWSAVHSVRWMNLVQEIILVLEECRAPVIARSKAMEHAHRHAHAVVIDRAEEAAEMCPCDENGRPTRQKTAPMRTKLFPARRKTNDDEEQGAEVEEREESELFVKTVRAELRVDSPSAIFLHSHIRLQASGEATNSGPIYERPVVDGVVVQASRGEIKIQLMHPLPPEYKEMDWLVYNAGNTTTSKAMLDAVASLAVDGWEACRLHGIITGGTPWNTINESSVEVAADNEELNKFNESQQAAIRSMNSPLSLIWGPPGKVTVRPLSSRF
ncbi:hypothetical protein BOTBODRAFT_57023 [Botryobasidium botryosum FD-172 SS1]|uniref:RNA-dependent RNA polymerase n=1 Tax=Botryobasidium botryosum (strain FD-172 SS1) TaxID=930990 RepID=A0A067MBW5_BOTB1|nr:hypothetical protein BOTBODRAFT_57023 [Botryobasidium botryosum FD-172 SS1]